MNHVVRGCLRRRRRFAMVVTALSVTALFILLPGPFTGLASGLNAAEQSLVDKAGGTFNWNGKEYRAKQTYIDQLISYLCRDDVDLTEEACAAAEKEMYGNVERGVTEGYLYALEGGGEEEKNAEADSSENGPDPSEEGGTGDTAGDTGEGKAEGKTGEKIEEKIEDIGSQQSYWEIVQTWKLHDLEVSRQSGAVCDPELYQEDAVWRYLFHSRCGKVLLIGEAICAVFLGGCLRFMIRRRRLSCRSRARITIRRIAMCMTAFACFLSGALFSLRLTVFSEQTVLNQIDRTSWYESVSNAIRQETARTMAVARVSQEGLDNQIKYAAVVLAARQQVKAELAGEGQRADLSAVMEPIRISVREYLSRECPDYLTAVNCGEALVNGLEERCKNLMEWGGMSWWNEMTQDFLAIFPVLLGAAALTAALGAADLICLSQSRCRVVKRLGFSLAGGFFALAAFGLLLHVRGTEKLWQEPEYMREFMVLLMNSASYCAAVTGGIGCCMAAMIFSIAKGMKYEG